MHKWAAAFVSIVMLALVAGQMVEAAPSSEAIVVDAVESTAPSAESVPAPSGLTDPSYERSDRSDFVRTELRLVLAEPRRLGEEADVERFPDDGVGLPPVTDSVAPRKTPVGASDDD